MELNEAENVQTDLSRFKVGPYSGGPKWKILIWYPINYFIMDSVIPYPGRFKSVLLRIFGAKVGKGLVIRPKVRIKYPWKLALGNNCWIGESVWIDNLENVNIGNNVCISQGAMLLTGNHDYTSSDFPYRLGGITLEDGVWIGAKSIVCPGVFCKTHSILTVNSVAAKSMEGYTIYSGNPALPVRTRKMNK